MKSSQGKSGNVGRKYRHRQRVLLLLLWWWWWWCGGCTTTPAAECCEVVKSNIRPNFFSPRSSFRSRSEGNEGKQTGSDAFHLKVRLNHILSSPDRPLDNLHATEPACPVALLASLKVVQLCIRAVLQRIGPKVWEVIPLSERLDIRVGQGYRFLCRVARVFINLG